MFRNFPKQCKFLEKSAFDETLLVNFENRSFPIPGGYDCILKSYYGNDYMTPVQADSAHGRVIIDTKHSYIEVLKFLS